MSASPWQTRQVVRVQCLMFSQRSGNAPPGHTTILYGDPSSGIANMPFGATTVDVLWPAHLAIRQETLTNPSMRVPLIAGTEAIIGLVELHTQPAKSDPTLTDVTLRWRCRARHAWQDTCEHDGVRRLEQAPTYQPSEINRVTIEIGQNDSCKKVEELVHLRERCIGVVKPPHRHEPGISEHGHARGTSRGDTARAVLDNDAARCRHAHS
jgi:hypothetical protein